MSILISTLALHLVSPLAFVADKTFDFGRPGLAPQQVVVFESNTALEDIVGRTNKVTGSIKGDVTKRTGNGKIVVDLASLNSGIDLRDEHMRSETWLNVAKYPNATFETTAVRYTGGNNFDVTGKFGLHGVTKTIKTKATIKYLPESELTKRNHFNGDVIQVKTKFQIKLSDFGIKIADIAKDKVSNTISISISVVGTTK